MGITEPQISTDTKLKRIAWLSAKDPKKKFGSLMHHFNFESFKDCYLGLDGNKAVGIDGIDKDEYGKKLRENLEELVRKMKSMSYRPGPVKEVLIPKEGKPGATRPLGISNLEDKIVQKMMQKILESIYEPLFYECSFGFRPGRGCHDAIKALHQHLYRYKNQVIIDIDLKNFFGTIDHKLLEELLKEKISDPIFMRYISRMFKAGVLSKGELTVDEDGVPQGSICSPILSNIFAHYAIDVWIEEMVKPACVGKVTLFRYADDAVICCELESDAIKIKRTLIKRLERFKLELNEEKTKLVSFDKVKAANGIEQGVFEFLGFMFYLGKSKRGLTIPKLKTKPKAMISKLKKVTEWIKQVRNRERFKEVWKTFKAKMRGHIQYYGVSFNSDEVNKFVRQSQRILFKWLNRRSQRKSFTWDKFKRFLEGNPAPKVRVIHKLF